MTWQQRPAPGWIYLFEGGDFRGASGHGLVDWVWTTGKRYTTDTAKDRESEIIKKH